MSRRLLLPIVICALLIAPGVWAQQGPVVAVNVQVDNYGWFTAADLINCDFIHITLSNLTNEDQQLLFRFVVSSQQLGAFVDEQTLEPLHLGANQTANYTNRTYPDLEVTMTELPTSVYTDGILIADVYTIEVTSFRQGYSPADPRGVTVSETFQVTNPQAPLLLFPANGSDEDNLPILRPNEQGLFSWTSIDPSGALTGVYHYSFTLVRRLMSQPLESAMNNPPIFNVANLGGDTQYMLYQDYAEALIPGQEYVWWVTANIRNCAGDYMSLHSQPWGFAYGYDAPLILEPIGNVAGALINVNMLVNGLYDYIDICISSDRTTFTDLHGGVHFINELFSAQALSLPYQLDSSILTPGETYFLLAQLKRFDHVPLSPPSTTITFTFTGQTGAEPGGDSDGEDQPPSTDPGGTSGGEAPPSGPGETGGDGAVMTPEQVIRELQLLAQQLRELGQTELADLILSIISEGWQPMGSSQELTVFVEQIRNFINAINSLPGTQLQWQW